ncbi:MAG: hypothetical protein RIS07_665, partial [Actinomycetota bacterium]
RRSLRVAERELHLVLQTTVNPSLDRVSRLDKWCCISTSDAVQSGVDSEREHRVGIGIPRGLERLESLSLRHGAEA